MRFIVILMVILSGCGGHRGMLALANEDQALAKKTSLTLEQRTFDTSLPILMKAFVNGFANKGLTVLTLEKDSGFMMAEGPEFLDYASLVKVKQDRDTRWNSKLGGLGMAGYALPDVVLKIVVNLYEKGSNKTLARMKINSEVQACMHPEFGNVVKMELPKKFHSDCPPSPTMTTLWYQQLWDEIEKSIFMQRETILE